MIIIYKFFILYIFFSGTADGSDSAPNRDHVCHLSELQDYP